MTLNSGKNVINYLGKLLLLVLVLGVIHLRFLSHLIKLI